MVAENGAQLTRAITVLRQGGLVAFPTETVYGLGADARNEAAVRKVFLAKKRPFDHPLIVHVGQLTAMDDWAENISADARALAKAFWPGPLTLVLHKRLEVLPIVTGNQSTVALRMPDHPVALQLLQAFGSGLVGPSANPFTRLSPTTAAAVRDELADVVDLILDGGACTVGVESTIVDMSQDQPIILRPGMITAAAIERVIGKPVRTPLPNTLPVRAPGMHPLHYAPRTNTVMVQAAQLSTYLQQLSQEALPVAVLHHGLDSVVNDAAIHYVTMPIEAAAYAHVLYQTLRRLDQGAYKRIIVVAVPEDPEWAAIRDRIVKASGCVTK